MLRVALPNKGTLADPATTMMSDAGYRQRTDSRDLNMYDRDNDISFFYLRPKDIATYVGNGNLDLGVTGHDLMEESGSPVRQMLKLGFGYSQCRFAVADEKNWKLEDLNGRTIATAYPRLVRAHLVEKRIQVKEIVKLDGAVEISIQLGLAEAIADVVSSGRTLRQHQLKAIGEPIAESEATLIQREERNDWPEAPEMIEAKRVFVERLRGVVYARQYLMIDYDCPEHLRARAEEITPGFGGPTVSRLTRSGWVGIRAMVRVNQANAAMDKLAKLGCTAILTSVIRSCRAMDDGCNGDDESQQSPPLSQSGRSSSPLR